MPCWSSQCPTRLAHSRLGEQTPESLSRCGAAGLQQSRHRSLSSRECWSINSWLCRVGTQAWAHSHGCQRTSRAPSTWGAQGEVRPKSRAGMGVRGLRHCRLHCLESFSSRPSCLVGLCPPQHLAVMPLMGPALFFFLPKLRSAC